MVTANELMKTATRVPKRGETVDYFPLGVNPKAPECQPQVAIVTRVHSPDVVNLFVLYDGGAPVARTSLQRAAAGIEGTCWDYMK